ncbi:MAG: sigma 54-interacting transcriptional regulator [Desulfobacteraceae bacterium]|nr:sigma 54-interacting transcriptional regulator [Desulfobacteraceae bacterium]
MGRLCKRSVHAERAESLLLQCSSCELEDVLEASHDGLFITDGECRVLMVNSAWERICGVDRAHVVGRFASSLVRDGMYSESCAYEALRQQRKTTIMLEMTAGDKVGQKIMATGIPIFAEDGRIKRVVVNVRDITEILYLKDLLEKTRQLNEIYAAELEQMRLQQIGRDDNVVARSPKTRRIFEMAAQVAKVDSTVLITGESGVGKEVIANAIHRCSHRSNGPLIKVNCGAIPENLLESELFGYEAGAFTGAKKQGKPGLFELADKGTLFLDEVGDIALSLQVKLLRALQDRKIMRVGGIKSLPVDVRIIAATNRNIVQMVASGMFREDLYYRLNVVSIEIPPLRERKEDIPPLVLTFLEKINKKYQFEKRFSPMVIDHFVHYSWPGNIRELENVIERMLVMTEDEEIKIGHLPAFMVNYSLPAGGTTMTVPNLPLNKAVENLEIEMIRQALKKHGSTRKAASVLRISQSAVMRKLKKYKIPFSDADHDRSSLFNDDLRMRL